MIKRTVPSIILNLTFMATLLIATWSSLELIQIGTLIITTGAFIIPVAFLVNDLIATIYGYKKGITSSLAGFGFVAISIGYFSIVSYLILSNYGNLEMSSFAALLGKVWRVLAASFVAFLISGIINDYLFKLLQKRRWILRVGVATGVALIIDSLLFVFIAFYGLYSTTTLMIMVFSISLIKLLIEIGLYPIAFWLSTNIKTVESPTVYEKSIRAAATEKKEKHD